MTTRCSRTPPGLRRRLADGRAVLPFRDAAPTPRSGAMAGRRGTRASASASSSACSTAMALPVSDALIEIYQADADGHYPVRIERPHAGFSASAGSATDIDGTCAFETIRPGVVVEDEAGVRRGTSTSVCSRAACCTSSTPASISRAIPELPSDPLLACVPEDRRRTLIASPDADTSGTWAVRHPPSGRTRNRVLRAVSSGS